MQKEIELRKRRCCFTGHRPEKLHMSQQDVNSALEREIRVAIAQGYQTFITGMARGVDIWAAEIVLRIRDEGIPVHLIAASPFEGFENSWPYEWRNRYLTIMAAADIKRFISPGYDRGCFQRRNEWMVDRCGLVIAVFNGEKGGTKNTIDYADRHGVPVVIID